MQGSDIRIDIETDIGGEMSGVVKDVEGLMSGLSVPILEGVHAIGKAYTAPNRRYVRFRFYDEGTFSTSLAGLRKVVDRTRRGGYVWET